jgi:hypothetical protein
MCTLQEAGAQSNSDSRALTGIIVAVGIPTGIAIVIIARRVAIITPVVVPIIIVCGPSSLLGHVLSRKIAVLG